MFVGYSGTHCRTVGGLASSLLFTLSGNGGAVAETLWKICRRIEPWRCYRGV
ncbi:hypothetical protein PF005_g12780 [Phytophthora fragariae]|uniref:Uncharacterized protein n=1 Tax=Phytophthora fragariae TaxID=53985 RepID=A0A6A4CUT4_9STRA|nr:hypothetical protein PF003_g37610 [Phytophthora fragariae]KAE8940410.1 hypothetical protein PF009_g9777 [Phytophthora fragariae]KAE9015860.1 hypothetical protein PF011_g7428 [Phytophthora fragariae]KAE9098460.1 hypothetical protein PF007_g16255 [Phytophthora fragariae]KAE9123975.1 hypothetical protein PF006_g17299 [Phytophthora fragariae]